LIKRLIKLIKDFVIWGVIAPPLKRNLILRFRRREHKNDERCIDQVVRRISSIETVERRRTSRSSIPLFFPCMNDIALRRIGLCFITLLVVYFIT
jgi:hypothetical protein